VLCATATTQSRIRIAVASRTRTDTAALDRRLVGCGDEVGEELTLALRRGTPLVVEKVVTVSAVAAVEAEPVTVTGKGESVKTIELVAHGYTVKYEAKSFSDTFSAIVNQCAAKMGDTVSGTTTYAAKGPVTVHVQNTDAAWTLTFTPLG
jgi:hypothetical protein